MKFYWMLQLIAAYTNEFVSGEAETIAEIWLEWQVGKIPYTGPKGYKYYLPTSYFKGGPHGSNLTWEEKYQKLERLWDHDLRDVA